MAVVKSPKNTKRKKLWVTSLQNQPNFKINKRTYLTNYSKTNFNSYRKLAFSKKKILLSRNSVLALY